MYIIRILTPFFIFFTSLAFAQESEFSKNCSNLKNLESIRPDKAYIIKAEVQNEGEFNLNRFGTHKLKAHCLVQGKMQERIAQDKSTYQVNFEIRMPENWNNKFIFQGTEGLGGVLAPAIGVYRQNSNDIPALERGYAVVSTDAGHQSESAYSFTFGLEREARENYGFNHIQPVTRVAKTIVEAAYAKPPLKSYFLGCGNGGREGLKAIQHYPYEFDGVVALSPAIRFPEAALENMRWHRLMGKYAKSDKEGKPDYSTVLSKEEKELIANKILEKCDKLDGLRDGLIFNFKACTFDMKQIACERGQNYACMNPEKAAALSEFYSGKSPQGRVHYANWFYDASINAADYNYWRLGAEHKNMKLKGSETIAGIVSHVFANPPAPTQDLHGFLMNTDIPAERSRLDLPSKDFPVNTSKLVTALQTNYESFSARGAKMILAHGLSDPLFSAKDTLNYYDRMKARFGEGRLPFFSKLFLLPGMAHCSGGNSSDDFDMLTALENWVENEKSPEMIIATSREFDGNTLPKGRSRPLCPYPQFAKYDESKRGLVDKAESFLCALK